MVTWKRIAPRGVWNPHVGFRKQKKSRRRRNKGPASENNLHNPFVDIGPLQQRALVECLPVAFTFSPMPQMQIRVSFVADVLVSCLSAT